MLDMSLLKRSAFLFIAVSGFVSTLGFFVPMVYLIDMAKMKVSVPRKQKGNSQQIHQSFLQGIPESSASYLLSIIGITGMFSRILTGYIADFPRVNSMTLFICCHVLVAIAIAAAPFCTCYEAFVAMSVLFGTAGGS